MKRIKIPMVSFGLKAKGGRCLSGQITSPRRGSLTKRIYRYLDTKRRILFKGGATLLIQYKYDPSRTGYISLIMLPNGIMTYILAPEYKTNQKYIYNLENNQNPGTSQLIKNMKNGSSIFNCELYIGQGSQILRAAGVAGVLLKKLSKDTNKTILKLKSGALRAISVESTACLGQTSNSNLFLNKLTKAGQIRNKGRRPRTRPSAMNPVDHPMGGRTKGGIHPQSSKGLLVGSPTQKKKHHSLEIRSARQYKLTKKH